MPYLSIQTNQSLDEAQQQRLMRDATALLSKELDKSEKYVMVAIEPSTAMQFAGNDDPCAYLEFKSIGLPENKIPAISASLCQFINQSLGIDVDRVYIEFSKKERHLWGWNGGTF